MTTTVIPVVSIQEVYSTGQINGSAPDGTPTDEQEYRGRIQKWLAGSVGGEFDAPDLTGMRVEQVFWFIEAASTPNVDIYLVDDNGTEYLIDSQNLASGSWAQTNHGIMVPPGFKIRVKSDQAIGAAVPIVSEDTGVTGDGVSADYELVFAETPVKAGTVSIVAGSVTFTDPGSDGILVGAGGGGGSGTIDYLTGVATITLNTPSDFNAVNALASYTHEKFGRVGIVIHQGWGQPTPSQTGMIGKESLPPSMQRA